MNKKSNKMRKLLWRFTPRSYGIQYRNFEIQAREHAQYSSIRKNSSIDADGTTTLSQVLKVLVESLWKDFKEILHDLVHKYLEEKAYKLLVKTINTLIFKDCTISEGFQNE